LNDATKAAERGSAGIPVIVFAALVIGVLAGVGPALRYVQSGQVHLLHIVFSVFFATNLLICYWEACLYLARDRVQQRAQHWRKLHGETGASPAMAFLWGKIPLRRLLAPACWADAWAAYSHYDRSYLEHGSYGFNVDIANGFTSWIPTLILYVAYSTGLLPAVIAGIIGVMIFWQWVYVTGLYCVSFRVAGRQELIRPRDMWLYVWGLNFIWIGVPLLGLAVSIRLILDGGYQVLGF